MKQDIPGFSLFNDTDDIINFTEVSLQEIWDNHEDEVWSQYLEKES